MDNTLDTPKKSKKIKNYLAVFIFISFSFYQFLPIFYIKVDIDSINEKIKMIEIDDNYKRVLNERNLQKDDPFAKGEPLSPNIWQKSISIEKTSFVEYTYIITPYIYVNNVKVSPTIYSFKEPIKYELLTNYETPMINIKYDNMLIMYPILILAYFFISFNHLDENNTNRFNKDTNSIEETKSDHIELNFEKNIKYSEKIMLDLNYRSIFLLTFGIFMAFIGMGVFYLTLPQTNNINDLNLFILSIIKPLFILFFIEAIAWFLLKQYRNLMEDFKHFYKIYLKRNNYKLAYYLLKEINDDNDNLSKNKYDSLINSLLSEDLSGKLSSGESTESLENKKIPDEYNKKGIEQILEFLKSQKN